MVETGRYNNTARTKNIEDRINYDVLEVIIYFLT